MTFLATWGCASYFLKKVPEIKLAARGQLKFFFVGAKALRPRVRNYTNFTITFPTNLHFKVLLKFKMATMDELHNFFVIANTQTLNSENTSIFTITIPIIWKCAGDFTEMATSSRLVKYLSPQKL